LRDLGTIGIAAPPLSVKESIGASRAFGNPPTEVKSGKPPGGGFPRLLLAL
jgi:hypothetical protein